MHVKGLMNMQYAIENGKVYVLEANPRASRTVPLVSKVCNIRMVPLAIDIVTSELTGRPSPVPSLKEQDIPYYGVKEAVFPFNMFQEVDPVLGPEMRSTGEVLGLSRFYGEAYYKAQEEKIHEAAALLKTTPADLLEKIAHLQAEAKALQAENESLKSKLAKEALGDVMDKVTEVKGVKLLAASVPDVDMNGLRDLGDQLKEKLGSGVVVLASAKDGKVSLLAMVTDDAMKKGAHAGKLIKEVAAVVGGGGGGRPNMAQAGGKNPEKIDEAVAKAAEVLEGQIA